MMLKTELNFGARGISLITYGVITISIMLGVTVWFAICVKCHERDLEKIPRIMKQENGYHSETSDSADVLSLTVSSSGTND